MRAQKRRIAARGRRQHRAGSWLSLFTKLTPA